MINDNMDGEPILIIFSYVKGMSVLQFIVTPKIERVKELLLNEDKTLQEIADLLNYKNTYYLIAQFKKVTGLTPSDFKRIKFERMKISREFMQSTQSRITQASS